MSDKYLEEQLEYFRVRFSATIGTGGTKEGFSLPEAVISYRSIF